MSKIRLIFAACSQRAHIINNNNIKTKKTKMKKVDLIDVIVKIILERIKNERGRLTRISNC